MTPLMLALCVELSKAQSLPHTPIQSVLFITDSIGAGHSNDPQTGYTWYVENVHLQFMEVEQARNFFGRNSFGSSEIINFLPFYIANYPSSVYSHVFINCGLWDAQDKHGNPQTPVAQYLANIQYITSELQAAGYEVVWMNTTHMVDIETNAYIDQLNNKILSLRNTHGVNVYGMRWLQDETPYVLAPDGTHFVQDTVEKQAFQLFFYILNRTT